jgi:hypothetical protein
MPNQPDEYEGYSPAAANVDTEGVNSPLGTAPGSPGTGIPPTQGQRASTTDTTGTSVAGIGAAVPGGSVADVMPWAGAGQAGSGTGQAPQSDYAVRPVTQAPYGFAPGQPDTEEAYGGPRGTAPVTPASPYPWVPSSTALTGTLDTQVGGGSALIAGLGSPPAYRAPASGVAAAVKDTTLTDIMGSMIQAMPLTSGAYAAANIDTSYVGAPAAPASLATQVDTYTGTAASPTRYYASQQGIVPSSLVVTDVTKSTTLTPGTQYTVVTALNGPKTSAYITITAGAWYTAGDTIALTYQYGSPQYYDSNLPAPQAQQNVDVFAISQLPVQLSAWGITTAAASLAVIDITQNNTPLVYNTDYTVSTVTEAYTPGGSYAETPRTSFAITWKPTSAVARLGDTIQVTYNFSTSVPNAPGLAGTATQTDNVATFNATPAALSRTGIVTPPASLQIINNQSGANFGKQLVLNVDYGVTVSGTGSTLTYSVVRLGTSTRSALNDNVRVTYSYGNAAYFTAGPVYATDKGVFVPWTPPAGSIQVDYYLIQSSDLGTMYVPAAGQPTMYGQMSPGGGASSGQPVYQTDAGTLSGTPFALSKTGIITPAEQLIVRNTSRVGQDPMQPGGTVLELGYDYTVTATGTGPWKTYSVTRVANSVNSVSGDSITVSYWYDTMGAIPLTSVADVVTAAAGVAALTNKDVATPNNQLIVYDVTTSKALAYGLDYTVSGSGLGPAEVLTISLITTGPAASGLTDQLRVYYSYGIVLSAEFRQGLVPNQVPIYTPAGAIRSPSGAGVQLSIAAGNRAGLGPFSGWSDWVAPLNYSAPQPGAQGTTTAGPGTLDVRNSINPIYRPDGTVKAGTGLGM